MIDGTFRTVPKIFGQLYTIHAPVSRENSRILLLVYSLLMGKSEEIYRCLFEKLLELAVEYNVDLQPSTIITDFEQASINASYHVFSNIHNKGCFFHLEQSG